MAMNKMFSKMELNKMFSSSNLRGVHHDLLDFVREGLTHG